MNMHERQIRIIPRIHVFSTFIISKDLYKFITKYLVNIIHSDSYTNLFSTKDTRKNINFKKIKHRHLTFYVPLMLRKRINIQMSHNLNTVFLFSLSLL